MALTFIQCNFYMWYTSVPDFPFGDPAVRGWLMLRACFGFAGLICLYCIHILTRLIPQQEILLTHHRLIPLPSPRRSNRNPLPSPRRHSLGLLPLLPPTLNARRIPRRRRGSHRRRLHRAPVFCFRESGWGC